jgi:hypothetical protein
MLQFLLYIDPAQMNNPKEVEAQDKLYRQMMAAIHNAPEGHRYGGAYSAVKNPQSNSLVYLGKN